MPKPKSKLNTYWAYDICISHLILDKTLSKRVFLECQTVPLTLNAGIAEFVFLHRVNVLPTRHIWIIQHNNVSQEVNFFAKNLVIDLKIKLFM